MKAKVFRALDAFGLEQVPRARPAAGEELGGAITPCGQCNSRSRRQLSRVQAGRLDLTPLLTHTYPLDDIRSTTSARRHPLDDIEEACGLFGERRDGVIALAIRPS
jgi:threonine dehydrogenase-like Zn-dependent dehydrogenase